MSEEQRTQEPRVRHEGQRRTGKTASAANDWRNIVNDARQWVREHQFAVACTASLVLVNLLVWLIAALAGFPFPLHMLATSMAEFNFGKLLVTLFLARGVLQLVIDAALWLVMLSIAQARLGARRLVLMAIVCAAVGTVLGLGLCWAIGWVFQDARFVDRIGFTLSPLVLPIGALMAASAVCSHLWRRRIRLIGYAAILVALLYSGNPGDYCILAAALIGHAAGYWLARVHAFGFSTAELADSAETGWHWLRSTSFEARRMFAAIGAVLALGPVVAITSHNHAGPLSTIGLLMSPVSVDEHTLDHCLAGAAHTGCFLQFDLLRASMPGAVLRSLLPTVVALLLAWGLYRGRRFAALLTIAINIFTAGVAVAYYLITPLSITHDGWDVLIEHGALAACVANTLPSLLFAFTLLVSLRYFPIRVGWRRLIGGVGAVIVALLACAGVYLLYGLARPEEFSPRATASALMAELPGRFLPIGFLSHMRLSFVPRTPFASLVYQGVGLVFWIVVLAVVLHWLGDVTAVDERARARAGRLVEAGGESMSFMTTWEGNDYWMSPTGHSAVAYRVLNGIALTCTGPFGDPAEWMDDLAGFSRYCFDRSLSPVFYSVHREQRDRLVAGGWQSVEVGSEMVVDPRGWKTTGKKWQDVRTAINKAKRSGIVDVQSTFLDAPLGVREQIEDISEEWAQGKALPEMKFTLGGVEELRDPRVRLLYAVDADGRVLAVTSWLPTWRDGRIIGWTLDFMRHRPDSPNGIMEFLIARMAERLRDAGEADPDRAVEFMSLSAAPLAGMNPERDNAGVAGATVGGDAGADVQAGPEIEDVQMLQHALQIVADWMEPAYGFHSLFNFKRKFQPAEAPVYVCYPDPAALPQIGLAVMRAYVPSVTPAEVAGMLKTLRA
ncbi:bifunctional lysylphosphatidylglycerol flippase/synthetase MprF [Bifidobacterium felsineum]|uniref:bifunctional lysylphosphatidylglycerol flippase/synthetase MprF n=1 Tax=Bifidobacterium felsineum TaxID=2045440 RepID=UPI001BDBB912|nr:phosphatidylglycerol lysyltransferase domain-containing protein [Bifidobacterium felsineum]MBT1163122.1 DUF2156 domain-containing protein [Bifidobacterium felsineum]